MRVTQSMISNNMLNNLNKSYAELDKYFNQLNTGKKINRPSDDPVAAMNGMGYRTELSKVGQYQRNTNELHNWFDNSDAALEQATSGLQRIRYLAVQASNGTYDEAERKNIAKEVEQIKADLIDVANTSVNGKYIFNGTDTDNPPIADTDNDGQIEFSFGTGKVNIEVSANTELTANIDGNTIFGTPGTDEDLFAVIDKFIDKLENNNEDNDIDATIGELDKIIDNVVNARADLGARMNRLELVENRLEQQEVIASSTLSKNEDVNYAEAITNLITQQSLHRAALSSGSQIIQPTLLDFLR
ncbi:flagellar hook-associated protein FlgL [Oceanobacillus sp. FSL H7-0719]|uniref:flagellar hook-associated protein FlgL n=1 Tax=Oceanobacillus sp. FSL H7-0719 TaxID=2954507 RepID=UPI003252B1A7